MFFCLYLYLFISFCLLWVFIVVALGFSLFVVSRGLLFTSLCGPLAVVASLVAEHRLNGSTAVKWDLPRPGIRPKFPALAGRFLITVPPQKSPFCFYFYLILITINTYFYLGGFFLDKLVWIVVGNAKWKTVKTRIFLPWIRQFLHHYPSFSSL